MAPRVIIDEAAYFTESDRKLMTAMFMERLLPKPKVAKSKELPVNDKIDLAIMDKYVQSKLVSQKRKGGLLLFNYTQKCVFERTWNNYTMAARGLITNLKGDIIARPFQKFFNVEEWTQGIPAGHVEVYEKVDGSMITATYDSVHGLVVASRGSFDSEQAQHALDLLHNKYGDAWMIEGLTYVFEVIYPENRIVVNYGSRDELVLLGVQNVMGEGWSHSSMINADFPFRVAERIATFPSYKDLLEADLKKTIQPNTEGYVLRFKNEFRLKLKGDEYLRLHRVLTNTNNKTVWEMCKSQQSFENLILNVPDEFMWWIKKMQKALLEQYRDLEQWHLYEFERIRKLPRPQFAAAVADAEREHPWLISAILYRMKDERTYDDLIWKALKPTELERPPVGEIPDES